MSTPATHKPTLEEIQGQELELLTLGHEVLDKEHEKVKSDINDVIRFLANDGAYVYDPANQKQFYDIVNNLMSALAIVDVVVEDSRMKAYLTQNQLQEPQSNIITEVANTLTRKKNEPKKTDPHEDSIIEFHRKLHKVERVERFTDHYAHALESAKILRILDDDEYNDAMNDLVAIHRTIFPSEMGLHIIRIHRLYIEMRKTKEREEVLTLGISHNKDLYRQKEQEKFMH